MNSNFELEIKQDQLDLFQRSLLYRFEEAKEPIQAAMGEKFFEIVRLNFGEFGVDRPIEWAPLSNRPPYFYAQRVGREYATLFVTGRLEAGVKFEADEEKARVYISDADVPYATDHQYGNPEKFLPARPYFPIDSNGQVTSFTNEQVMLAAQTETARLLGGGLL